MKQENCKVHAIHQDSDGGVRLVVCNADGAVYTLPCTYRALLRWREKEDDTTIVRRLASRRVDIWVENSVIVSMETLMLSRTPRPDPQVGGRGVDPQQPVDDGPYGRARGELEEAETLRDTESPWIYAGERAVLGSIISRLKQGSTMTRRQRTFLDDLQYKVERRKDPTFYRG